MAFGYDNLSDDDVNAALSVAGSDYRMGAQPAPVQARPQVQAPVMAPAPAQPRPMANPAPMTAAPPAQAAPPVQQPAMAPMRNVQPVVQAKDSEVPPGAQIAPPDDTGSARQKKEGGSLSAQSILALFGL